MCFPLFFFLSFSLLFPFVFTKLYQQLTLAHVQYNFVLSAALSSGIAISAILMLFSVQWVGASIEWWGNTQIDAGCEGKACTIFKLAKGERFYPWWDPNRVPAP